MNNVASLCKWVWMCVCISNVIFGSPQSTRSSTKDINILHPPMTRITRIKFKNLCYPRNRWMKNKKPTNPDTHPKSAHRLPSVCLVRQVACEPTSTSPGKPVNFGMVDSFQYVQCRTFGTDSCFLCLLHHIDMISFLQEFQC